MGIYECSCLPANLSPSGEFELCEVCRLEEENEDDNAAEQSLHLTLGSLRLKKQFPSRKFYPHLKPYPSPPSAGKAHR
ncbi:MAG TPA: hypothetical protein VJL10_09055 [Anaerolineales bacterium]|nr:hypothetical protein [Anaerolineales bacterium]